VKALVADDDALNRDIVRRMLALLGVPCEEAADGVAALVAAGAAAGAGEPFDLILLDIAMPGLDGLQAARRLKSSRSAARVVAITGHEVDAEMAEAGFDAYVPKPVTIESLKKAISVQPAPSGHSAKAGGAGSAPLPDGHERPPFPESAWTEAGSLFRHCPACGSTALVSDRGRRWICPDCGFEYFHNVATAAGVIVEGPEGVLLLERAKEPARGSYCLPGGFVEPGERAEDAALRECREELGWAPAGLEYLASYPNLYRYRDVPYATCDLYFRSLSPAPAAELLDPDPAESSGLRYAKEDGFPWDRIAFESNRRALLLHFRRKSRT
jgi:CheY-like chemotaxis protein